MLILKDLSAEVPDTNAFHWNLEEQSAESTKAILLYGYNASDNFTLHQAYDHFERKVYFNNWAPCEFAQKKTEYFDAFDREKWFDEVYSICPYSSNWLNKIGVGRKYKPIFYPFHCDLIPPPAPKKYDVIYHGGIHGQEHIDCLRVMSNFNYRYCTMTHHINQLTERCIAFATNVNLQFKEKINLIADTKISVCYNLVHALPEHISAIKSYDNWKDNEAFSEIDRWNVMPQFKTRMHEAAISKTLNLVLKDSWNIAEHYYEPNEEFIYFEDTQDLENKIKEIKNNWEDYQGIIDEAYQKAMNYTTDNFISQIRRNK